jgi:hypothetical protein
LPLKIHPGAGKASGGTILAHLKAFVDCPYSLSLLPLRSTKVLRGEYLLTMSHSVSEIFKIDIKLPVYYLDANRAYAAQQLTRAGVRLAPLLDSISWQSSAGP